MKKVLLPLCLVLGCVSAYATELKVGVVDFQKVLQDYPKVKAKDNELKKQFAPQKEKLEAMQKQINEDLEKYNRDSAVMKEADKKAAESKIREAANKLQSAQNDFQKKTSEARSEAMQSIVAGISDVVKEIATEEGLSLVVPKAGAVYSDPKLDRTEKVIKKLKK